MLDTATIGGVDGVRALPAPWMNRRGRLRRWWAGQIGWPRPRWGLGPFVFFCCLGFSLLIILIYFFSVSFSCCLF